MAKKKRSKACVKKTIRFKTKRGKVISFTGKQGASCGPRPKPKTGHLNVYKRALANAARSCKRKNLSRGAFLNCVSSGMPR